MAALTMQGLLAQDGISDEDRAFSKEIKDEVEATIKKHFDAADTEGRKIAFVAAVTQVFANTMKLVESYE